MLLPRRAAALRAGPDARVDMPCVTRAPPLVTARRRLLAESRAQLEREAEARARLEDNMKRAFMRGRQGDKAAAPLPGAMSGQLRAGAAA